MKVYRSYKDSGANYIGEIPQEWDTIKIKFIAEILKSGGTPNTNNPDFWDGDFQWYTPEDFRKKESKFLTEPARTITRKGFNNCSSPIFKKGSIILTKRAPIGKVAITKVDCAVNQGCYGIQLNKNLVSTDFVYYYLLSKKSFLNSLGKGTTFLELGASDFKDLLIPFPSLIEQKAISNYLDKKTSEITNTILKKTQLIEVLKKTKESLITQSVLKGLDLKTKMKNSGLDWIGEVPEHWKMKKLRFLGTTQNGISKSAEDFGFGFPFVSYGNVYNNSELPKSVQGLVNSNKLDRMVYSVKEGDVFFTRTSETIEEIGFASTCLSTISNATYAGFLIRFRPNSNELLPNFSKYYFRSDVHRKFFIKEMNIVTRASLAQDLLKNLIVLLPPLKEQKEISDFLDKKTSKIDKVINTLKKQIELMEKAQELLVEEVVTGKIDVRNEILV